MMIIKKYIGYFLGVVLAGVLMGGLMIACSPQASEGVPIVPEYNSNNKVPSSIAIPNFEWYIVSNTDLEGIYKRSGRTIPNGATLYGMTGYTEQGEPVIVTTAPQYVDDNVACTLGHEVMHIAFGKYHAEVEDQ
jgi:hypothetical protein